LRNEKYNKHFNGRIIIVPVVVYGCETWSLTLREEHRLRVFENRVLRMIFGPKRDEVTEEWRKLHNEKLNDEDEIGRVCSTNGGKEERILVGGKARGKETVRKTKT
jgi:hypothetical protein